MENTIKWCGYDWSCKMEGGRIIHPAYPHAWYSDSDNVITILRNGEMHLRYAKNTKEIKHWDGKTYYPTIERAIVRTQQHFDYGHFEIEAKMAKGLNICCAFWLSGFGNWPPEIDIVEAWSEDNNYSWKTTNYFPWFTKSWRTTYNVHYNDKKIRHKHLGSKNIKKCDQPLDPIENWIKYEVDWLPSQIIFRANGVVTKIVRKKYAEMLTRNLNDPKRGHLMDAIIDINIDDPEKTKSFLDEPFKVRNFKYVPMK